MSFDQKSFEKFVNEKNHSIRNRLLNHSLYMQVNHIEHLREFMRNHVFAVWDFMSLLKRLQREVAGNDLPWFPPVDKELSRFVNEIVLGEECDEDGTGGYVSHFHLYLDAMSEIDADSNPMQMFLSELKNKKDSQSAFENIEIPEETRCFVTYNLRLAMEAEPHKVAAAFCYGREDIIPGMFQRLVETLQSEQQDVDKLRYYLNRHIELDGDLHGPLSHRLVFQLCQNDPQKIEEAAETAYQSLEMRIQLWDGVLKSIEKKSQRAA